MRQTFRTRWSWRRENRLTLWLCVLAAMITTVVPVFAEDDEPESFAAERAEIERMRSERAGTEKVGGPIVCTNDSIRGKFEDLVAFFNERQDGFAYWGLTAEAETCLQASTLACSAPSVMMLKYQGDSSAHRNSTYDRWLTATALADIFGHDVQLRWIDVGSTWPGCKLDRLYVFR